MPKGDINILKADPEDGTTPIANLLLEALAMSRLSGGEKGIVLFLWRETYGWQDGDRRRTQARISLAQWASAVDTTAQYAARLTESLEKKRIIIRADLGKGKGYLYRMNTTIAQWDESSLNRLQLSKQIKRQSSNRITPLSSNRITPVDTKLATPKESIKKDKESSTILQDPLLFELTLLSRWGGSHQNEDMEWLREFQAEFRDFSVTHIRGCRDYHSSKSKHDTGIWKNRLRNWMTHQKGVQSGKARSTRCLTEPE